MPLDRTLAELSAWIILINITQRENLTTLHGVLLKAFSPKDYFESIMKKSFLNLGNMSLKIRMQNSLRFINSKCSLWKNDYSWRKKTWSDKKKKKAQHWSWTSSCGFDIKGKTENKKRFASMKSVSINLASPAGYCVLWFDFDLINSTQLLCTWRKQRKKWGRWMVVGVRTPSSKRAKECQKQQKENRHTGTRYSDQLEKKKKNISL